MDKIEILPQITVYKNLISDKDLDLIFAEISKSQEDMISHDSLDPLESVLNDYHGEEPRDKKDGSLIRTWESWYTYGIKSVWGSIKDIGDQSPQAMGYLILQDAIGKAHFDYIEKWKDAGDWTYDIPKWDIFERETDNLDNMCLSSFEILQHKLNLEKDYTIGVHTDWHDHRKDEPGPKQILTYTIYINDDYEGGEIDFVDEATGNLIVYKPKRGDVTVFPSGRPYWHGARAVTGGSNKVFIRTFGLYRSSGTKEWNNGLKNHGLALWLRMTNDKVKDFEDAGNVGRQLIFEGGAPNDSDPSVPIYIKSETYIDGRDQ